MLASHQNLSVHIAASLTSCNVGKNYQVWQRPLPTKLSISHGFPALQLSAFLVNARQYYLALYVHVDQYQTVPQHC